jgi:hypothetical protein
LASGRVTWRAAIREDFPQDTLRLLVGNLFEDGHADLLMEDGTWQRVESGVVTEGAGSLGSW